MRMKYIKLRRKTYWYQRRIPEQLQSVLGFGIYSRSLKTHDLATAVKLAEQINARWVSLMSEARPSAAYAKALADVTEYPHELSDALAQADPDDQSDVFASFPFADRLTYHAAQERLSGQPRRSQYAYSMLDGRDALKASKQDEVEAKTLAKYDRAVSVFLGDKTDDPLAAVTYSDVAQWLDSIKSTTSYGTRSDYLSYLGQIYDHAQRRQHVPAGVNPFRRQEHGKNEVQSYRLMDDDFLRATLELLDTRDHLPAVVARHSGMRLSEIFNSELAQVDGVWCFQVRPSDSYRGAKTEAGNRTVPIRKCLIDDVRASHGDWVNHAAYSKKFGRAKSKVLGHADRTMAFHSLRVAFITYAGRARYSEQQVAWLVGHEEGKGSAMTGQLYFKGYTLDLMQEIVEAVPQFEKTPTR